MGTPAPKRGKTRDTTDPNVAEVVHQIRNLSFTRTTGGKSVEELTAAITPGGYVSSADIPTKDRHDGDNGYKVDPAAYEEKPQETPRDGRGDRVRGGSNLNINTICVSPGARPSEPGPNALTESMETTSGA